MNPGAHRVSVDGVQVAVHFRGHDCPLDVELDDGARVQLTPWTYRDHLRALARNLGDGMTMDVDGFCRDVLAASDMLSNRSDAILETLAPLALWWATGGDGAFRTTIPGPGDSTLVVGDVRIALRPWTYAEQCAAVATASRQRRDRFDAVHYLDAMVRATVARIEPDIPLEQLNAAVTAALLDAVTRVNTAGGPDFALCASLAVPAMAARTLRLCTALGWPPSRLWTMSAADVEQLEQLLDCRETADRGVPRPVANRPTGLAAQPNAVVFRFDGGT